MSALPRQIAGIYSGGSGTWTIRFPEDLKRSDVRMVDTIDPVETPFGRSGPIKLLDVAGAPVLRFGMHGWHRDENGNPVPTWRCSWQMAWIAQQTGAKWAVIEGSVGGIQNPETPGEPLPPWSVVVLDDYIMHWVPPEMPPVINGDQPFPRMRQPFCSGVRAHLAAAARSKCQFTVFDHGVYVTTPLGRFETDAEIRMMAGWGAHVVGQTAGHEISVFKQVGLHIGHLSIVSNHAESRVNPWVGDDSPGAMAQFYRECAEPMGNVMADAMVAMVERGIGECHCNDYYNIGLQAFPIENA